MAFDGIVTKAICSELTELCNARIDKIFEPNKNTIILGMYSNGNNYALNICIDAQYCRINLTTNSKPNPQVAPNFCMVLRKNLIGLKLKNIITFGLERLIVFEFEGFDEIDDIINKKLIVELMGKHSNIILVDENNIIIDSLRHIKDINDNYRDILPHTRYIFPSTEKKDFLEISNFEDFYATINLLKVENIKELPSAISNSFNGISKNFIISIIKKLDIFDFNKSNVELVYNYIKDILDKIGTNQLSFEKIVTEDSIAKDYFLVPDTNNTENINFALNFFIDDFYFNKETSESFKSSRNTMLRLILDTLKKYQKRLSNIDKKLEECKDMNKYKIYGELITANLYKIPNKNTEFIEVENYYDNNNLLKIDLNKKYLPSINAKMFFKKYNKLKNALEIVTIQKKETIRELNYIESVIYELENATSTDDLINIFEEISENNIFKEKTSSLDKNTKKSRIKKSRLTKNKEVTFNPIKYNIDGYTVLVGRNNKENDYLTLKYANKNDIWFHTKDFHGSHTILKLDNSKQYPNSNILIKTAQIAAKHSKAKNSSNVPVDYCEVKFVKKPSGSKPGMVIYSNNKTLNVNPL